MSGGILHRHEDGREHRHFSAGDEIGGQIIDEQDGAEEHTHGILGDRSQTSGPVVWRETDPNSNEGATAMTAPTPTTYAPEVLDGFLRQMTRLFGTAPYGGLGFRHDGSAPSGGRAWEPMTLGEIVDNFASYLETIRGVAAEATETRAERDQLLHDIGALGRLFERAGALR